jgi:hypothetical protein
VPGAEEVTPIPLNGELARALGLPKTTTKAVLTIEVNKLPTIAIECFATDGNGKPIVEIVSAEYGEPVQRRLAKVRFMVRLMKE